MDGTVSSGRWPTIPVSVFRVGDGTVVTFSVYAATIRWHGMMRQIIVLESEVAPVLGVGLLWGNNLCIDFQPGGDVAITELPDC